MQRLAPAQSLLPMVASVLPLLHNHSNPKFENRLSLLIFFWRVLVACFCLRYALSLS